MHSKVNGHDLANRILNPDFIKRWNEIKKREQQQEAIK